VCVCVCVCVCVLRMALYGRLVRNEIQICIVWNVILVTFGCAIHMFA